MRWCPVPCAHQRGTTGVHQHAKLVRFRSAGSPDLDPGGKAAPRLPITLPGLTAACMRTLLLLQVPAAPPHPAPLPPPHPTPTCRSSHPPSHHPPLLPLQHVLELLKQKGIAVRVATKHLASEEAPESYKARGRGGCGGRSGDGVTVAVAERCLAALQAWPWCLTAGGSAGGNGSGSPRSSGTRHGPVARVSNHVAKYHIPT